MGSLAVIAVALLIAWLQGQGISGSPGEAGARSGGAIDGAFAERRSDVIVQDAGRVIRILADDNDGSRHQRFVVELPSGLSVLVAHNIDLAPRVPNLRVGDALQFSGEYEWNDRGGVIHWTHHDPKGRRDGGWIKHAGRVFE